MSEEVQYDRLLVSLALIESRIEGNSGNRDRLSLFLPFVVDAVLALGDSQFDRGDVMNAVRKRSGIRLPDTVVNALLNRMVRRQQLVREHGSYTKADTKIPFTDIAGERRTIEERHGSLVDSMGAYARAHGVEFHGSKKVRRCLAAYLDLHFRNLAISKLDDRAVEQGSGEFDWVGRYLLWARDNEPAHFETAVTLVRGRIIYDAAFLPGFVENQQSLKGLVVYLDSPVVCRALGYHSEDEERLARQAIDTLRGAGVACRVFDRTVNEIMRVLSGVCERWDTRARFERQGTYDFFLAKRGFERGDIERIASDPEVEIRRHLGLQVVDAPQREREYTADEEKLAKMLVRPDGDLNDHAVWHDVDCVAAILTLRKGRNAATVPKAGFFFGSESYLTIKNVSSWWSGCEHRSDLPPIFSVVDLANLAWLYGDSFAKGDYGKESLVAACAASAAPSDDVWRLFSDKLMKLVDDDKIEAETAAQYLYSMDSRAILSECGVTQDDMESDPDRIVQIVAAEADKAYARRLNREREEVLRSRAEENEKLHEAIEEIRNEMRDSEERRKQEEEQRRSDIEARIRGLSKRNAKKVCWLLGIVVTAICIGSFYAQYVLDIKGCPSILIGIVSIVISVFLLPDPVRRKIELLLYNHYRAMLLGDPDVANERI